MRKLGTRERLMIAGLLVVAFLAWYVARGPDGAGGGVSEELAARLLQDPPVVNMTRLEAQIVDYDPKARNLFAYWTPPPAKVERPKPKPVERPKPKPVKRPPRKQVERPTPAARPPAISFRYLGYLGPKDDKIAVFEEGKDLLLARAGDVVQDSFRLVEFKFESVVMGYTDQRFKDQTTELEQQRKRGR